MRTIRGQLVLVLAATLALGGCKKGEVYDRSLDETRSVLKNTEVPLRYFGASADTDYSVSQPEPNVIAWKVSADGYHLLTYKAVLEAEDEHHTRVTLTMEGAEGGHYGNVAERMKKYPAIRNLYTATMHEATDSALEARHFDTTRFYPQIAAAAMSVAYTLKPPKEDSSKD